MVYKDSQSHFLQILVHYQYIKKGVQLGQALLESWCKRIVIVHFCHVRFSKISVKKIKKEEEYPKKL